MPGLHEAFDRIGRCLEQRLPLSHAAGAALAVTDRGETLGIVVRGFADAGRGTPVRPDTRFQIGSISKSFAAIVALQEAEAGRLDLHAPVTDLLPWLVLAQPYGPITCHHLLTHSSGLPSGTEDMWGPLAGAWALRACEPGFAPGERVWYSNAGYDLLGSILERVTDTEIHDLLRERVLRPLGMDGSEAAIANETRADIATGYVTMFDDRPPQTDHPLVPATWSNANGASGSIVSNVTDMSAYMRMILRRGEPLLSGEAFDLWTRPVLPYPDVAGFDYAYGLRVGKQDGRRRIGHSGSTIGYSGLMLTDPEEGLGCLMLMNGLGDRDATVRYALHIVRAAVSGEPLPEIPAPPDPGAVADATAYAGVFRNPSRELRVSVDGDRLRVHEDPLAAELQVHSTPDVFLVRHPLLDRSHLRFGRDEAGRVVEAFHGSDWLPRDGVSIAAPEPHPPTWEALPGLYRSNDPWIPVLRVVLRKGGLALLVPGGDEPELPLVPLDDGSFRVGEESWRPERISFDRLVDGTATRAAYCGGNWYRSFEE